MDQLQQIRLFLEKDRFVLVLKQMAVPFVPAIMGHPITGQQPAHYCGDWNRARYQQQLEMVRNQRPCKARCCRISKDVSQPADKIVAIFVILEYPSPLDSAANDMVMLSVVAIVNRSKGWYERRANAGET